MRLQRAEYASLCGTSGFFVGHSCPKIPFFSFQSVITFPLSKVGQLFPTPRRGAELSGDWQASGSQKTLMDSKS